MPPPHAIVSDHELVRCIGRGSYGEVWLARSALGTWRAVKIVRLSRFKERRPYERELAGLLRVEPLSRSEDGLVDILHVGHNEAQGCLHYVMELADDASGAPVADHFRPAQYVPRTLSHELKLCGRLRPADCIQLGVNMARALSCLHRNGLIHRDVKPSNIMFVGGVPKLGDIGLVGLAGDEASYVGTEGYIPPEGPGTPQADLYSLGKVLYEVSTGKDRLDFPQLPPLGQDRESESGLAELNAIFLKACAPNPRDRYQSAGELHDDLLLLQSGRSVRKARASARHRRTLMIAAGIVLTAGLAAVVAKWPRQASSNQREAQPALAKPEPIRLSAFFNSSLTNNWFRDFEGNDLSELPQGRQVLGGMAFHVEGLIQLDGGYARHHGLRLPREVQAIPVGRRCRRLHFLHGAGWTADAGQRIAQYTIRYTHGHERTIPVLYGDHVANWWVSQADMTAISNLTTSARVAWVGSNFATRSDNDRNRLAIFSLTWENPEPDSPVESIGFMTMLTSSCPFLLAVTCE